MEKMTIQQYTDCLNAKKWDAHNISWLYIEVNAKDLMEEKEPGAKNITAVCKAMLESMLEGDCFVVEPKIKTKVAQTLTVRYYVDNLSPERKKYSEVN